MSAAEIAKQANFTRELKKAQAANQKKQVLEHQHNENLGRNIKSSRYTAPIRTDAQKKQALKEQQRWHARMIASRKRGKKKASLTKKYAKIITKYNRVSWTLLYTAAYADVFFDVLTIPILSTVLSFCTSLYIIIGLWNVGPKKERTKRRMIRISASIIDLIPIINLIPIAVIIVYKAQESEKKRVHNAKRALKKLSKI